MKRILKNINLLNILLIVAILIFINYTILPLFDMSVRFTLPTGKKPPVHTDYTMIAENNLFHPERKIPVDKTDNQPLEQPEFILYGTLITDDIRIAYLGDRKSPVSTAGRGKRQTVLKLGDVMSGYILQEIAPDTVVMERGDDRIRVNLTVSTKERIQGEQVTKSGGITSRPPLPHQPPARYLPERVSSEQDAGKANTLREKFRDLRKNDRKSQSTQGGMTKRESRSINPPPPTAGDNLFQ